ncbi:MAG TPA: BPSL0067 family protein [Acidocella sp.]|nr:BPSL0067 family protein [Acidocella sp.]
MPYIATNPWALLNQSVGTGQCVALVEAAANMPNTKYWQRGIRVRGATLAPGTIIATFDPDGRYGNHTDGRSHAAIYLSQNTEGIKVIDQWVNVKNLVRTPHLASPRLIRWKGLRHHVEPVNDGDDFYVVQ